MLSSQVYWLDPSTGQVRVATDQFVNPNEIAFVPGGKQDCIRVGKILDIPLLRGVPTNRQDRHGRSG